jgi:hypothetical protein
MPAGFLVTDKRRMTVDELLGPELTSELGIKDPRRVVEATDDDTSKTAELEARPTNESPVLAEDGHSDAVADEEELASKEESQERPPTDENKASKPARVPLPPTPGQPLSRGRIPSLTAKNKPAAAPSDTESAAAPLPNDATGATGQGESRSEAPLGGEVDRAAESRADEPRSAARFPRDEAKFLWTAVRGWLNALPAFFRAIIVATPVVLVLAVVVAAVQLVGPGFERAYLVADHTMLAVPTADETTYGSVGGIERNEEVLVLERQNNYALVRDPVGRVGWVQDSYLSELVPPVGPDLEFTRCYRRINEDTAQPCQERAAFQSESCMAHCEELDNPTPCEVECQSHRTQCENSCALTLRGLRAAAQDDSTPDESSEPKAGNEPAIRHEPGTGGYLDGEPQAIIEETDAPASKKKTKKKRKKRKKRKKKKR